MPKWALLHMSRNARTFATQPRLLQHAPFSQEWSLSSACRPLHTPFDGERSCSASFGRLAPSQFSVLKYGFKQNEVIQGGHGHKINSSIKL